MRQSWFILMLIVLFVGCASSPIHLSDTKVIALQEAIVFGRVKVISQGTPVVWSTSPIFGARFSIFIFPEGTPSAAVDYTLTGDGSFYWHLTPGRYTVAGFEWKRGNSRMGGHIVAKFVIPEAQSLLYVGTLTVLFTGGRYYARVEDEYGQALQELHNKFPELRGEALRELLQLEQPL